MRQEKTHKICLNHLIDPVTVLAPTSGSEEKSISFTAADFADGAVRLFYLRAITAHDRRTQQVKTEKFAIKFGATESVTTFKQLFEQAKVTNQAHRSGGGGDGGLADKLAVLKVVAPPSGAKKADDKSPAPPSASTGASSTSRLLPPLPLTLPALPLTSL